LQPEFIKNVERYIRKGGKVLAIGDRHLFRNLLPENAPVSKDNPAGLAVARQNYGKGTIACIDDNISLKYLNTKNNALLQSVQQLVNELFPQPQVIVSGDAKIHITLNKKDNNLLLHLVNVGDHLDTNADNSLTFNLPAITAPINIALTIGKRPKSVLLQPEGKELSFTYADGKMKFEAPGLDVYSIVQVVE